MEQAFFFPRPPSLNSNTPVAPQPSSLSNATPNNRITFKHTRVRISSLFPRDEKFAVDLGEISQKFGFFCRRAVRHVLGRPRAFLPSHPSLWPNQLPFNMFRHQVFPFASHMDLLREMQYRTREIHRQMWSRFDPIDDDIEGDDMDWRML